MRAVTHDIRHNAVWIPRSLIVCLADFASGACLERGGTCEGSLAGAIRYLLLAHAQLDVIAALGERPCWLQGP